ncbi:MAG: hypothetical protein IT256_00705 [Chitinophagaceae bacterium]|nr:hypothetical protein [Chitinophagaceae bacterium]
MKSTLTTALLLAAIGLSVISSSCKKEEDKTTTPTPTPYTCSTCTTAPEAKAANDASSKGIYKGIIIGSTGTVKFDISNDLSTITAVLQIDGKTGTLTSAVSWVAGTSYIADFTGSFDGSPVTVKFSVDASGANPKVISSSIPGHTSAAFIIDKEKSSGLLECFEGTYTSSKPENGTFNILVSRKLGKFGGITRETGDTSTDDVDGTIDASNNIVSGSVTMGKLSGDEITGTFKDNNGNTITINGKRTL